MIKLKETVIVEGKYDKIKLSSIIDAVIIETNGFRIFKDEEKIKLIRKMAAQNGIVVLTDSDNAGFMIRQKLNSVVPEEQIKHAYIPDILGKEKRKAEPSKEGKLGVEGVEKAVIINALKQAGIVLDDENTELNPDKDMKKTGAEENNTLTKADFFELGLSGKTDSKAKRKALLKELDLPENMPVNSLLKVINSIYGKKKFLELYSSIM